MAGVFRKEGNLVAQVYKEDIGKVLSLCLVNMESLEFIFCNFE